MTCSHCPKCGSANRAKAGFIQGVQRWQCKNCSCKYTRSTPKGKDPKVWEFARELYTSGVSLKRIGELIGVSTVAVLKHMRKADVSQSRLEPQNVTVVELDELCTFLTQKNVKFGCGWLFVEKQEESWSGKWVVGVLEH